MTRAAVGGLLPALLCLPLPSAARYAVFSPIGLHWVPEGHVGVYWFGGAVQKRLSKPGFHWMLPFVTQVSAVQVTVQTDRVTNIPCGTSGGTNIVFSEIEVVNQLRKEYVLETVKNYTQKYDDIWIYDKIHFEMNQFCSHHTLEQVLISKFDQLDEHLIKVLQRDLRIWAPGIRIINIRISKPKIPARLAREFESLEERRTMLRQWLRIFSWENLLSCALLLFFVVAVAFVIRFLIMYGNEAMARTMLQHAEHANRSKQAMAELDLQATVAERAKERKLDELTSEQTAEKEAASLKTKHELEMAKLQHQKARETAELELKHELAMSRLRHEQEAARIQNEIHVAEEKAKADALAYQAKGDAAAITQEVIQLEAVKAIASNTKIFFGDKLPNIFRGVGELQSMIERPDATEAPARLQTKHA